MFALTDRTWLWVAAGFYFAGFAQGTISLLRTGRPAGAATYALIAIGYVLQLVGLGVRGRAVGGCPLGNIFEVFQFTAWSAVTLYLVVGVAFRNSLLGYFSSCLAAALTVVSLSIPRWDATLRIHIFGDNPWLELHAALAVFSYGIFALLALVSLLFLLRNQSLKQKNVGGWHSFLPSILDLDHMGLRLLAAGAGILTLSLAVGSVYWLRDTSTVNLSKILLTVAVWVTYLAALGLRLKGWLVTKRFAWACMGLFVGALVSLWAVDSSRHTTPAANQARL